MTELVEKIITKKFDEANGLIKEMFDTILAVKLLEVKKSISAKSDYRIRSGDMTGKTCTKCHKGKYQETTQHDDMDGILHCTNCNSTIRRWKNIKEDINEEQLDEAARVKIVKARIRNGKIQRRKKVATLPGYTMRQGKLTRMSVTERRKRKMGARRGKIKRKAKMSRALMKRKRSMMKRKAIGLK